MTRRGRWALTGTVGLAALVASAGSGVLAATASDQVPVRAQPVTKVEEGTAGRFARLSRDPLSTVQIRFHVADAALRVRSGAFQVVETSVTPNASLTSNASGKRSSEHVTSLNRLVATIGAPRPRFGSDEALFDRQYVTALKVSGDTVENKNSFYVIDVRPADAERAMALLRAHPQIDDVELQSTPAPLPSPSLAATQGYRTYGTPNGLGILDLPVAPGASGANVKIIDIEYSWNQQHEDLDKAAFPDALISVGIPIDPFSNSAHGTAVLGMLVGDDDGQGITGIVPDAEIGMVNANGSLGYDVALAISTAHAHLTFGDVLLIEQQAYGPLGCDAYGHGCLPVEWNLAVYTAIRTATAAGIIVVEAGGNGSQNLDNAALYGSPFPAGRPDSGAIMVGAGSSVTCSTTPRNRLYFSNYGTRVDLQGWGHCVATTGYGDLFNGGPNALYTSGFGGTSSASPIVAGAAAIVSSVAQQQHVSMSPEGVRALLRATGNSGMEGAMIGPFPNLTAALSAFVPRAIIVAPDLATEGQTLEVDAGLSSDPQGHPLSYSWDLNGDGTYGDSTSSIAQFRPSGSSVHVGLRVTDPAGATGVAQATITLRPAVRPPTVPSESPVTTVERDPATPVQATPFTPRVPAPTS
jgi:serine protease